MKILITGATGSLGRKIIQKLLSGNEIIALVRNKQKAAGLPVKLIVCDITNIPLLKKSIKEIRPEIIIHLAAIVAKDCEKKPDLAQSVNVDVTRELANAAAANDVKLLIFSSSAAVYRTDVASKAKEDMADPQSVYGKTKHAAELVLKKIAAGSNLNITVLRIFNVYGPGVDGSLVNKLVNSDSQNPVRLIDPDNFVRDYIHIDQLTELIEQICIKKPQGFNLVNAGNGLPVSTTELLRQLKAAGIKPVYKIVKKKSPTYSVANITKLKQLIRFQSAVKMDFRGI